jgi:hypothetical protein
MFSINCLEITVPENLWNNPEFQKNNRSIYKNLLSDKDYEEFNKDDLGLEVFRKRFFFNDFYEKKQHGDLKINPGRLQLNNFFGNKINVQAVVGMNGSGKSTLMDLMFMAINNFAFIFEREYNFPAAKPLCWIKDLCVSIYFSTSNESDENVSEYKLNCSQSSILFQIRCNNEFVDLHETSDRLNGSFFLNKKKKQSNYLLHGLLKEFFFTIVSNYSLQSFVTENYINNCLLCMKEGVRIPGSFNFFQLNEYEYGEGPICWIESIFHKNDGYTCPIVLNPKRDDKGLNINLELTLAKYREISLLLWAKNNNKTFIDGYKLQRIEFKVDPNYILRKLEQTSIENALKDIDAKLRPNDRTQSYEASNLDWLMVSSQLMIFPDSPKLVRLTLAYLIKKIESLVKYPSYRIYDINQQKSIFKTSSISSDQATSNFGELILAVQNDSSHIVTKIQQALHFIKCDWTQETEKKQNVNKWFSTGFTNTEYYNYYPLNGNDLNNILNTLPPPIFKYDIYLSKAESEENNEPINIKELSSGEQQLIQTISTHIYHIRNLISVIESNRAQPRENKRPEYPNINLVLDEMEICFHPEFQRQFVNHLIKTINNMGLNDFCYFNIFLITHSPFVISDIPSQRILYLENGSQDLKKRTNSFAGNIGEMFYDSFFLKSTIGAFAETKIKNIVKEIKEKRMSANSPEVKSLISCIGDSVIKSLLKEIR